MRILKYILIAISCCGALLSCKEDKMPYLKLKDANVYFDLNTSRFDPSVVETASKLKVPLILAGMPGTYPVSVTVETDTSGIENPAIEGIDYTIREKTVTFEEGYGTQYIEVNPINNEERQPNRSFKLLISSTSKELVPNPANKITITIVDGGHPLLYMKGAYKATAIDRYYTGERVSFNVSITPDPDDDNAVYVENIPLILVSQNLRFKMVVNAANGTCTVPADQDFGSFNEGGRYGDLGFYYSFIYQDEESGNYIVDYDEDVDITFKYLNGGNRLEANSIVGAYCISGPNKGQIFLIFEDLAFERINTTTAQEQAVNWSPQGLSPLLQAVSK